MCCFVVAELHQLPVQRRMHCEQAEMCSDSFQLLGMAERGFLPAALAKRSRHGTPTLAIILSSLGILMLVTFDFLQVWMLPELFLCQVYRGGANQYAT